MSWLTITIIAYFLQALSALGDKFFLSKQLNPKTYAFYGGVLGSIVLLLIPFVGFSLPDCYNLLICFLTGSIFVMAVLIFYQGLEKFEVSRIVPAIGALLPIFTFILSFLFFKEKNLLDFKIIFSFPLLVLGSFFITRNPNKKISLNSFRPFKISLFSAFLFSLFFILSKYIFNTFSFWNGFILIRLGSLLTALLFIFTKEVKEEIFGGKFAFKNKKMAALFLLNQATAGGGVILQNLAIALASASYLAIINALEGIRYVFVFLFTIFLSKKFPTILEEKITKKSVLEKIIAILFIVFGFIILTL
jgi:drug/metabolite transporter (DMT)-like permease